MKLADIPKEFLEASIVIKKIEQHGFEAYFVGGSVRDTLLGKEIHDVDIATSAYPEEIKQIFDRTVDVGIEHGTVMVLLGDEHYEITTFRTESDYQDFRRPDSVTFVRSLEEDLKRRDFTINALALNKDGTIIDLFDGLADLRSGVIRAVGVPKERFHEDALRMMRGLRFASQLDFEIEAATLQAIQENHSLLSKISVERITVEFEKLLLGRNRRKGLLPFIETGCYRYCPGLETHCSALEQLSDLPNGVIEEARQGWTLLINELQMKSNQIRPFLKQWKLSNQMLHEVSDLVYGLKLRLSEEWNPMALYRLGLERALAVEKLLFFYRQNVKLEEVEQQYAGLPIKTRAELKVTGNDLLKVIDRKPGKWLGELIDILEKAVVNGELENTRKALLAFSDDLFKGE